MDLRSMLTSSDSTESAIENVSTSSDKAVCITMRALTWFESPKHQPLVLRVSTTASVEAEVALSSIFVSLLFSTLDFESGTNKKGRIRLYGSIRFSRILRKRNRKGRTKKILNRTGLFGLYTIWAVQT